MLLTEQNYVRILDGLKAKTYLSLDTETTGLRPFHGDTPFAIILGDEKDAYYLDYRQDKHNHLMMNYLAELISDPNKIWFMHNAKFDMHILAHEGFYFAGTIHCTQNGALLVYNEHLKYTLDACLKRIGFEKDDRVKKWITDNKAWTEEVIPGRIQRKKKKHYDRVPFDIIVPYALADARGTFALGVSQESYIREQSLDSCAKGLPPLSSVLSNERRLTKTVFNMEKTGVLIDQSYCVRAAQFENKRASEASQAFLCATGQSYQESPLLFKKVFEGEKDRWMWNEPTKTGQRNPSFDSEALARLTHPAAKEVLTIRDAKAKSNFYTGFIYHSDSEGRVHPHLNQDGTVHGRFSSSDPNFQNLKKDEDDTLKEEFVVRRAIIPTPGFFLCSIDYKTMEYVFMLEQACKLIGHFTPLAGQIARGKDFHQATADLATEALGGRKITRGKAKTSNFLELYGGGVPKLAAQLGITEQEAVLIRKGIRDAAPEIKVLTQQMMRTAETRGYVRNWLGRRCYFPEPRFSYRAPNYLVAGGCADIMKVAMNQIDEYLSDKKSRMILNIHDENIFEIALGEETIIPKLKGIMENVYTSDFLPLKCSVSTSTKSLADLEDWDG